MEGCPPDTEHETKQSASRSADGPDEGRAAGLDLLGCHFYAVHLLASYRISSWCTCESSVSSKPTKQSQIPHETRESGLKAWFRYLVTQCKAWFWSKKDGAVLSAIDVRRPAGKRLHND